MSDEEQIIKSTVAYIANQMAWCAPEGFTEMFTALVKESNNPVMVDLLRMYTTFEERVAYINAFYDIVDEEYDEDETETLYKAAGEMDAT